MKKKFTFLIAAVMLLMMVLPMKGWAATVTFRHTDFTGQGTSGGSGGDLAGATIGLINITGKGYGNNSYLQVYANNYLVFTPINEVTITKIELTATSSTYIRTWSASDGTINISGSKATWSGSSSIAITLTNTHSSQARLTSIVVTYSGGVTRVVTLGDTNETLTETSVGAGVTLPSRSDESSYAFEGWSETNLTEETTTATIIPAGEYHPTADITLYPVYSRSGSATTWTLIDRFGNVSEGVYAVLSSEKKAFNGEISSGHGQSTNAFVFDSDNVATSVPDGICEITMVSSGSGYKMYNEEYGYLYVDGTSAGHLVWAEEATEWMVSSTTNWICSYNNTTVFLRSYTNKQGETSFRTYSSASNSRLYFARKGSVTTTYYISVVPTSTPSITASDVNIDYNVTSGSIEYSISNGVEGGVLTAPIASSTITDLTIGTISNTTVSFTCSGNTSFSTRTAIITLTYTYNPDQTVTKDITITQGPSPSYTVTYKANEGTGNDLVDNNGGAGYASGVNVIVKANEGTDNPNFTRTGHTFSIWNTVAGGGGTSYSAGNYFSISSNINLFAQWTKNNYYVAVSSIEGVTLTATYDANTITEGNNANVPFGTAVTLAVTDLGEGQSFEWSITKNDGGDDVTEEVLDGTTLTVPDYAVTIGGTIVTTYTVTYDCNGGTSGCPENVSGIVSGASITLAAAPTKTGNVFMGWSDGSITYQAGASYTVNGNVTLTAQWAEGGTGIIKFGKDDAPINNVSVNYDDNLSKRWYITTAPSTCGFSNTSTSYSQVGISSGTTCATSITFTMTLSNTDIYQITGFSAKFGCYSGTTGDITLKVGSTVVGMGSFNGTSDFTVTNNQNALGNVLTVTVEGTSMRVKCYEISYTYAEIGDDPIIDAPNIVNLSSTDTNNEFAYNIVNPVSGKTLSATTATSWISNINVDSDKVIFTTTENTNPTDDRQGSITLSYDGAENKVITINQSKVDYAILPLAYNGNGSNAETGFTFNLSGTYSDATTKMKLEEGKYVIIKLGEVPSSLSYDVKANGTFSNSTFDVMTSTDGQTWTSLYSHTTMSSSAQTFTFLDLGGKYIKWVYTHKGTGNVGLGNIKASTNYNIYSDVTIENVTIPAAKTCTIYTGATLTVSNTLTNNGIAADLIIEDGGQLITSSSNVAATVKKNITAASQWGNGDTYIPNNWYFIAAPITGNVSVDGLRTTGEGKDYDLYTLKESTSEWINQKEKELTIAQEKGYLYASEAGTTVTFAGTVQPNVPAGITVGLEKALEGWNLVGNPFPFDVYVNHSYYELDGERKTTEPVGANTKTIAPCTAIVVKATSAEDEITFKQTAFSEGSLANNGNLQMTLTQTVANSNTRGESSSQTLDNAIVSFNEGSQLGKFYFGTQDANLYIPMDNEEYAIVSSSAQGEMPVNFRAYVTGEYTITVNPEEVEMGYLHLIDNIAGVDVDLLANPSYTFNARYDDYESRFRLVFSANMVNADLNDDFAFFSNGQLIIANEGEATLQVIDVNGRIVATESISGTCSKAINAKAGVYVLRLINGTDVKTQKIIVK